MAISRVYPSNASQAGLLHEAVKPALDVLYDAADTAADGLANRLRSASGTVAVSPGNVNNYFTYKINFPEGRFANAPAVTVNCNSGTGASGDVNVRAINITAASFDLFARNTPLSTSLGYSWIAVGT